MLGWNNRQFQRLQASCFSNTSKNIKPKIFVRIKKASNQINRNLDFVEPNATNSEAE